MMKYMKTLKFSLLTFHLLFLFGSCEPDEVYAPHNNNNISLEQLLRTYELWSVDINSTRGNGQTAEELCGRLQANQQHPRGSGQQDFRFAGEIRRLRIQQIPRRRLRRGGLSNRLSQGALSSGVPLRHVHQ